MTFSILLLFEEWKIRSTYASLNFAAPENFSFSQAVISNLGICSALILQGSSFLGPVTPGGSFSNLASHHTGFLPDQFLIIAFEAETRAKLSCRTRVFAQEAENLTRR